MWTATGALNTARFDNHQATLLPNGKVLIAGGHSENPLSSAEVYDPTSGTWALTGALSTARFQSTATLLPNGKVLVVGGGYGSIALSSAELYDPTSGTWTAAGALNTIHYIHTATLLPNGKVLVAGAWNGSIALSSAELYDPVTGTWTATGALGTAHSIHTATLLPNGKVLVAGGSGNSGPLADAELYDLVTGTWAATGTLRTAHNQHSATMLPDGRVLVAGGENGGYLSSAELYDSGSVTFTVVATGTPSPTYQWRRGGTNIPSATNATLIIASAQTSDAGSYDVVVTNNAGSVTSNAVTLTVNGPSLQFTCVDLGTLGRNLTYPQAINNAGQIVGFGTTTAGEQRAFLYANGTMNNLGSLGGTPSLANDLSSSGSVVGQANNASNVSRAFIYSGGIMTDIGTLGGGYARARAMNDSGVIVGASPPFNGANYHAFSYSAGVWTDLGTPPGGSYSEAHAINSLGQIVGVTDIGSGNNLAFLYAGGAMTVLGTLGGSDSQAVGINNLGQIVGVSTLASGQTRGFLFSGGVMSELGHLGGNWSMAQGINSTGQIVGMSTDSSGKSRPFIYLGGAMMDLSEFLPADSWSSAQASGINDCGQIIGWRRVGESDVAFVLNPPASVPAITAQPAGQLVEQGQTAAFTVLVTCFPPPTYQWRKGGANLAGATGSNYTIASAQTTDVGSYDVVVANSAGSVTSSVAVLTVTVGPPVLSNVTASQTAGTREVAITYTLSHPQSLPCSVAVQASRDNGETWINISSVTGAIRGVASGSGKEITWNAGVEWPGLLLTQLKIRITADTEMASIPAGTFTMGSVVTTNTADPTDGLTEATQHAVTLSAFYLAKTETTYAYWVDVRTWAIAAERGANIYDFSVTLGAGKGDLYPVHSVSWYDVVKWCNAKSEREGLMPAYYANDAQTTVIRTGDDPWKVGGVSVTNTQVKWGANGYRLPTEAEWEYAARGGLAGTRFPWGDTITHAQANYNSSASHAYDVSPTRGYHPTYGGGTSPVGTFGANFYGLQDMAGNVNEWCWDWYESNYGSAAVTAPLGPVSGWLRVFRGGSWGSVQAPFTENGAMNARCADRYYSHTGPDARFSTIGFRLARSGAGAGAGGASAPVASAALSLDTRLTLITASATITGGPNTFGDFAQITITSNIANHALYYSTDGSTPTIGGPITYTAPFTLTSTKTIRALAVNLDDFSTAASDALTVTIVPTYALTLATAGGGTVAKSPSAPNYLSGSVVTLTATSDAGWNFLNWTGDATGTSSTTTVTMDRVRNVQAIFGTALTTSVVGSGTVLLSPATGPYPYGSVVRLTPKPNVGSYFSIWGGAASGSANPLEFTVTLPTRNVSALFSALGAGQVNVYTNIVGNGAVTVSPQKNMYAANESVTLAAVPGIQQVFTGWSGDAGGAQNPLVLALPASKSVTANFRAGVAPTITDFTPKSGLVGTSVIITGTNFDPTLTRNTVYFGALRANVTTATPTQLTVSVPAGATYGPIRVTGAEGFSGFTSARFSPVTNGTVVAWGSNSDGQASVPVTLTNVVAIDAANSLCLALTADRTVVAWGLNNVGQANIPSGLSNTVAIATGGYHCLALGEDGRVTAWGQNDYGETNVPTDLSGVVAIAAGRDHNLALKTDGTVVGWGLTTYGQTSVPANLTHVIAIAAGHHHSLALKADGTVVAWGYNIDGQCSVPATLSGVVAIAAGTFHSVALKSDGTVIVWGSNSHGQGIAPAGLSGVVAVSAGHLHNLALKEDGAIVAWGFNSSGQTSVPDGLPVVVAVDAGNSVSIALVRPRESQTITFGGIADKTFGAAPFALIGSATSGLPVAYSVQSGPATIAGNTVTITGVGAVTIRATQVGDVTYNLSPPVDQSFTVTKANQTITFGTLANRIHGDEAFTISATASAGLVPTFSIVSGPATVTGNTVTITGVGTVVVRAAQAGNDNYNAATNVDQSFTVTPKALTVIGITVANKVYDGTTAAVLNPSNAALVGVVAGDSVTLDTSGATGAFDSANIGTGKTVTISGLSLSGVDAAKYTLTPPVLSAAITGIAPIISTQPQSQTVSISQTVTFTVVATDTAGVTYQWRKEGVAIVGATGSSLTLGIAQPSDAGSYDVVVTNAVGSVTSSSAVLTVTVGPPVLSNVIASQTAGTREVAITYILSHPQSLPCSVTVQASRDSGVTWETVTSITGAASGGVTSTPSGAVKSITWNAGADWPAQLFPQVQVRVTADDANGFVLLPAGTFTMGNGILGDGAPDEQPTHAVTLTAFSMAKTETTWAEWKEVRDWAVTHGYSDLTAVGAGKADTHPVQSVSWYDVVKWCNAKSEKDGLVPMYYTNDAQTTVYQTGNVGVTNTQVKWSASGYRLPTEAEWEYAARGGLAGKRFPWGDMITHSQANYKSRDAFVGYDVSPTRGYHPTYATEGEPYTSSVGSFPANGFGLHDMVGNVEEWCWDRYGSYGSAGVIDPQGPVAATPRVWRGGGWYNDAYIVRIACRIVNGTDIRYSNLGFRMTRSSVLTGGGTSGSTVSARSPVFSLDLRIAPSITSQPANVTVTVGQTATFTAMAAGGPTPAYQWRKGGSDLAGATNATLTIVTAAVSDAGNYDVVATNILGSATSNVATLSVNVPPAITSHPQTQAGVLGGNVSYTVVATGTPTPSYQWYKGTDPLPGATGATYMLSGLTLADAGSYKVVATNVAGSATSNVANLTIDTLPTISTPPASQTVAAGTSANFSVIATGQPAPTYQWKFSGAEIPGATQATLTILTAQATDSGNYTVTVTNLAGSVTSPTAVLTVNSAPVITQQPSSRAVAVGANVSFTVAAAGAPAPTYHWSKDGGSITGATSATYAITGVQATHAGDYTVTVSNTLGAVTSSVATLSVNVPVAITTQPTNQTVNAGSPATFTVVASGSAPISFQWNKNGTALTGATAATFTIPQVNIADVGTYTVTVSNSVNLVESQAATLTVNTTPAITTQPVSQAVGVGANVVFSVVATGSPTPSYQWQFNGNAINGATGAALTFPSVQAGNAGSYTVVATNLVGSATSAAAGLTVVQAPVITVQPVSQAVNFGGRASLSVTASGQEPMSYQWRKSGVPLAGATAAMHVFLVGGIADAGTYDVIVTAGAALATTTSAGAELFVYPAPVFGPSLPGVYVVSVGANLALTAADEFPLNATFQWKRNGRMLSGANGRVLSLAAAQPRDAGWYQLVTVASGLTATSAAVFVRVSLPTSLVAWGLNTSGQAVPPTSVTDATEIAAGYDHGLALRADGTVVAWGGDSYGQRSVPAGLRSVVRVAAGPRHSLALLSDGTVVAWGEAGTPQASVPAGLRDVVAIAAGRAHNLALKADGTVFGWGAGGFGQEAVPLGLSGVVAVAAGFEHSLALRTDGTVAAWGNGASGRTTVPGDLTNVIAVSAGTEHSLALRADGRVFAWGNSEAGRLAVPTDLVGVVGISAGQVHNLAVKSDGAVVAWGGNDYRQAEVPLGLSAVLAASSGSGFHSLVLRDTRGDAAPVITTQPSSRIVDEGAPVTFSVSGTFGTAPLSIQWRKNSTVIGGATNTTYRIAEAAVSDTGNYDAIVSNTLGSATSTAASLTVNALPGGALPRILVAPAAATVLLGRPAMFQVEAAGTAPLNYQWRKNGTAITGATSATLVLAAAGAEASGTYAVEVKNTIGSVVSADASLTVFSATSLQATTQTGYVAGGTLTLSNIITFTNIPASLGWQLVLPPGWSFASSSGHDGQVKPAAGATDALEWAWSIVPPAGVNFEVVLNIPASSTGAKTLAGVAILRVGGAAFEVPLNTISVNQILTPTISSQPANRVVGIGTSTTMTVSATGLPPLSYAWTKNGEMLTDKGAILGSHSATLSFSNVGTSDAGLYACQASNPAGTATSNSATLVVVSASPTHAVVGAGYAPGTTLTITNTLTYSGEATALGWSVLLPTGWSYVSGGGAEGSVKPGVGATDLLEWAWSTLPASPATFTYTLNVPTSAAGDQQITALAIFRAGGAAAQITAKPDPLVVSQITMHSADTDRNYRISLQELTRVIELYNTRNGTTRTGCYIVQVGTEDGYALEPTRASSVVVTLTRYHSADSNRDGKLDLFELTRVIELYNHRSGTVRTGAYHAQAGTEDGFAPGP